MKTCTKCGEKKALTHFHKDSCKKDGHRNSCKKCTNAKSREHFSENRDRRNAVKSEYRKRNKGTIKEQNIEYLAKNPWSKKARDANYAARKHGAKGSLCSQGVKRLFDQHGWCCYYCDVQSVDPSVMTLDHVVPLNNGGSNTIQNCVPACKTCNSSKADSTWK